MGGWPQPFEIMKEVDFASLKAPESWSIDIWSCSEVSATPPAEIKPELNQVLPSPGKSC
jgi:hypothetical protein